MDLCDGIFRVPGDDATSEQRGTIEAAVDQSGVAEGREYVSKAEALTRFRRQFTDLAALTTDLGDNPFPASLEVRSGPARKVTVAQMRW